MSPGWSGIRTHAAIFGAFGEARDYWVRSTRDRPDRIYASKPIVRFLRGKTQLNGGWGQKADAAAQLHNAGYIIVDGDDAPVTPPERYEHLIGDADRIRLCARNYYVEPAREKGASEVAIRAGDLGHDMGLLDRYPAVCSALAPTPTQRVGWHSNSFVMPDECLVSTSGTSCCWTNVKNSLQRKRLFCPTRETIVSPLKNERRHARSTSGTEKQSRVLLLSKSVHVARPVA